MPRDAAAPPRRRGRPAIPRFSLYGEPGAPAHGDLLHLESLASRSRLHQWEIEPHVHPGLHQVIWLREGAAEVSLEGQVSQAQGPLLVIVPAGAVHGFRFASTCDGHVLTLSPRAVVEGDRVEAGQAVRQLFSHARWQPVPAAEVERLARLFGTVADEFESADTVDSPVASWLVRALVWRLAQLQARAERLHDAAGRGGDIQFTRFLVLLETHYAEHWPVSRYAQRLGLSPERLNRLARAELGRNALAVIHERLAREACRRLVYLSAPISRIASDLGFDDPAYFCRFVRRHTGSSPRAFRAGQRGA